jgi:hypothetical protein
MTMIVNEELAMLVDLDGRFSLQHRGTNGGSQSGHAEQCPSHSAEHWVFPSFDNQSGITERNEPAGASDAQTDRSGSQLTEVGRTRPLRRTTDGVGAGYSLCPPDRAQVGERLAAIISIQKPVRRETDRKSTHFELPLSCFGLNRAVESYTANLRR